MKLCFEPTGGWWALPPLCPSQAVLSSILLSWALTQADGCWVLVQLFQHTASPLTPCGLCERELYLGAPDLCGGTRNSR